jgi:beta-glucanase (GH16 family)
MKTKTFTLQALTLFALAGCSNPPEGPDYGAGGSNGSGGSAGAAGQSGGGVTGGGTTGTGGESGGAGTGGNGPGGNGSGGAAEGGGGGGGSDAGGVLGHPDPNTTYPAHDGFTLYLVEEFEQSIDVKHDAIWTYSDGGLDEGDVRFVPEGLSFANGKLVITVQKKTVPGSHSYAENKDVFQKPLMSGELRTKFNNFRYGRYEVRLKAPNQNGNYINTMFAFRTPKYQDWRELDLEVTGDKPGSLTTNVIFGNNQSAWSMGIEEAVAAYPSGDGASALPSGFNNRTDFHTYAFEWTPGIVKWYVDDVLIRVKNDKVGQNQLPVPEKSTKIMMNLWVFSGSGFGGDPTANTYPMSTEYEWFRFYKWDQDTTYPCSNPPACLLAEDLDESKNNADDGL